MHADRRARRRRTRASSTNSCVQATTSAPPRAPPLASSGVSAPITRMRDSSPCRRSSAASFAVATASQVAPPPARRARTTRAVTVAVRLDDRAQPAAGPQQRAQVRAVALDRAEVDSASARSTAIVTPPASPPGCTSITSPAITWSAPRTGRPRPQPARACASTPAAAPRTGRAPSTAAPDDPGQDVAGAGGGQRGRSPRADHHRPPGRRDDRVVALQQHHAARALRRLARARQPVCLDLADSPSSSRPELPACGVSTVGAGRSRSDSSSPANAFSPSASITSGLATARATAARTPGRRRPCRSRARARRTRSLGQVSATTSAPCSVCAPSSSGRPRSSPRAGAGRTPARPTPARRTWT